MATTFRVDGIGVGDAETGINRIVPAMTAGSNRIARGCDSVGVLDVLPQNFKITGTNISNVSVGEGIASAYGYDLRNPQSQALNGSAAVAGFKYYFVIADWDLTVLPAMFQIRLFDNGSGASYTPEFTDNLITSPNGKYSMILWRLKVNTSGDIIERTGWNSFDVLTIKYTDNSVNANNYSNEGTIKNKFSQLDIKNSEQDTRLTNMGFKQGVITNPTYIAPESWWAKEGNVVYGYLKLQNIDMGNPPGVIQSIGSALPNPFKQIELGAKGTISAQYQWRGYKVYIGTDGNIHADPTTGGGVGSIPPDNVSNYFCYNSTRQKP